LVIAALPVLDGAVNGTLAVNIEILAVPIIGASGDLGQIPCLVKLDA
jgi:hypothetical protein